MIARPIIVPVLGALLVGCAQPAEQPAVDTEADLAAIDQVRAQELAAINDGDMSMGYVTADFVAMPPGSPAVMGPDGMREWMEAFMSQFTAAVEYTSGDVMISGDQAVEHYTGTLTMTPADGGESMTETLKGIHVYQRQADGSWKMTHDIWNSD